MQLILNWGEAAPTAPAPLFATSPDTAPLTYTRDAGFASRYVARHFRLSPAIAPTVAALAGLGGGA